MIDGGKNRCEVFAREDLLPLPMRHAVAAYRFWDAAIATNMKVGVRVSMMFFTSVMTPSFDPVVVGRRMMGLERIAEEALPEDEE